MLRCEIGDSAYRAFTVILRTELQLSRPHGEEARAARRLEPWQQVRTRGHPSRRPRFARAPQDEVRVVERFTASEVRVLLHAPRRMYAAALGPHPSRRAFGAHLRMTGR